MSEGLIPIFPIEVKKRELDSRFMLAAMVTEKAGVAIIGQKSELTSMVSQSRTPTLWLEKGLAVSAVEFYRKVVEQKGKIHHLNEEGGIHDEHARKVFETIVYDRKILPLIETHYFWGQEHYDFFGTIRPDYLERAVISGNPRFDLCKPWATPYYDAISQLENRIKKEKYLLFSSTFTRANPLQGFKEDRKFRREVFAMRHNEFGIVTQLQLKYRELMIEYFSDAIQHISKKWPNLKIVYRPHPSENVAFYKRRYAQLPNVTVTNEGSIREWLPNAIAVIHHDCTTAIEGFFHQTPILAYHPIFDPELAPEAPAKISKIVDSRANLIGQIEKILCGEYLTSNADLRTRKEAILPTIANLDSSAAEIIANRISKATGLDSSHNADISELATVTQRSGTTLKRKIAELIFSQSKRARRAKTKFPGLSQEEIDTRIQGLLNSGVLTKKIVGKQIGRAVFALSCT